MSKSLCVLIDESCMWTYCRHNEFVNLKGHFAPLMTGKYESAFIFEENEDLYRKGLRWMAENHEDLSFEQFTKWCNEDLLLTVPAHVIARYAFTVPIDPSTGWRWMKKLGCKNVEQQQGFYNDHHGCE